MYRVDSACPKRAEARVDSACPKRAVQAVFRNRCGLRTSITCIGVCVFILASLLLVNFKCNF